MTINHTFLTFGSMCLYVQCQLPLTIIIDMQQNYSHFLCRQSICLNLLLFTVRNLHTPVKRQNFVSVEHVDILNLFQAAAIYEHSLSSVKIGLEFWCHIFHIKTDRTVVCQKRDLFMDKNIRLEQEIQYIKKNHQVNQ